MMLGRVWIRPPPPPTHTTQKVDFLQASLVEFPERAGRPVYAIERLIDGAYVKYNRRDTRGGRGGEGRGEGARTHTIE